MPLPAYPILGYGPSESQNILFKTGGVRIPDISLEVGVLGAELGEICGEGVGEFV
jgi:hypothetical protein